MARGDTKDLKRGNDIDTSADTRWSRRGRQQRIRIDQHDACSGDRDVPTRARVGIGQELTVLDHHPLGIDGDVAAVGPSLALDRTGQRAVREVDEVRRSQCNVPAGGFGRFGTDLAVPHEKIVPRTEVDRSGTPWPCVFDRDRRAEKGEVSRSAGANDPLNRNVPCIPPPSLNAWNSSMKAGALLLEIVEFFAVSVFTLTAMLPAGAAPLVSALIWEPFARLTV